MTHTDRVKELAEAMNTRMRDLVGGRMWMSAHMRRGDCEFSFLSQVYANSHFSREIPLGHAR